MIISILVVGTILAFVYGIFYFIVTSTKTTIAMLSSDDPVGSRIIDIARKNGYSVVLFDVDGAGRIPLNVHAKDADKMLVGDSGKLVYHKDTYKSFSLNDDDSKK